MTVGTTLREGACRILLCPDPAEKARLSAEIARAWHAREITEIGEAQPPERPARPDHPELRPPRDMPRRRINSPTGRIAFIHAIAHIELNAIDLAWDLIARFGATDLPRAFFDDWVDVARDEARHFSLLIGYLETHDAAYGDLPAHDGLWEAAESTTDDILARLALVPLVLEARGLDTAPMAVEKLTAAGDQKAVDILSVIAREEVAHVAAGVRWFEEICEQRNLEPAKTFQSLVRSLFKGELKPPFAKEARDAAGFPAEYYEPLSAGAI
ncbi:MAG: ferritin-like domain-containing protein [Rhodospirillaceae bacterium]